MNLYLRNFCFILGAALASSVLGGLFAAFIAILSPEFARGVLFAGAENLVRYAAAAGMIVGLFLGAGAMAFVLLVAAMANWFKGKKPAAE